MAEPGQLSHIGRRSIRGGLKASRAWLPMATASFGKPTTPGAFGRQDFGVRGPINPTESDVSNSGILFSVRTCDIGNATSGGKYGSRDETCTLVLVAVHRSVALAGDHRRIDRALHRHRIRVGADAGRLPPPPHQYRLVLQRSSP